MEVIIYANYGKGFECSLPKGRAKEIVEFILNYQSAFLLSGDISTIRPLSTTGVAKERKLNPSTVIRNLNPITSFKFGQRVIPTKYLCPGSKYDRIVLLPLIKEIYREPGQKITVAEVARLLRKKLGRDVPLRTVTKYLSEVRGPKRRKVAASFIPDRHVLEAIKGILNEMPNASHWKIKELLTGKGIVISRVPPGQSAAYLKLARSEMRPKPGPHPGKRPLRRK